MQDPHPTTAGFVGLGAAVLAEGFDAHAATVAELVATARCLGIRPVLTDIVADETSPLAPRLRALGKLLVALSVVTACPGDARTSVA